MFQFTSMLGGVLATALCSLAFGQPPRLLNGNKLGTDSSATVKTAFKDFEGVVWEFKVIDRKTKKTESVGRFRVKEDALFLVRMKEVEDKDGNPPAGNPPPARRGVIAQKLEAATASDPTERIGEFDHEHVTDAGEVRLNFDIDDKYELSGRAYVKRTAPQATIWSGYYDDNKKTRWNFELRKIDE